MEPASNPSGRMEVRQSISNSSRNAGVLLEWQAATLMDVPSLQPIRRQRYSLARCAVTSCSGETHRHCYHEGRETCRETRGGIACERQS